MVYAVGTAVSGPYCHWNIVYIKVKTQLKNEEASTFLSIYIGINSFLENIYSCSVLIAVN